MLTTEEKRKYIKQIMLPEVGIAGQEKIRQSKVAVVGCGGLGCPVILYLAAAGVGTIGIIDFDIVNITNIHRQIIFGNDDTGKKKTSIIQERISKLHPEINIIEHDEMLREKNAEELLKNYDIVIDGCDNFTTRYIVNDTCVLLKKPLVYGSILGYEAQVTVFNYKGSKNLRDIFPDPPNPEDVPDCSENGVLATIPGITGTLMANETMKIILGKNVPENRLWVYNFMAGSMKKISF